LAPIIETGSVLGSSSCAGICGWRSGFSTYRQPPCDGAFPSRTMRGIEAARADQAFAIMRPSGYQRMIGS
jgi:hypothetical protein